MECMQAVLWTLERRSVGWKHTRMVCKMQTAFFLFSFLLCINTSDQAAAQRNLVVWAS